MSLSILIVDFNVYLIMIFQFLEHFVHHLEEQNIVRPVVLILDGHTSRLTLGRLKPWCHLNCIFISCPLDAVEYSELQNIQLVLLHPHASHVMQPNDLILNRCASVLTIQF